ncbi:putative WRKY transcription factor 39 [Glycine soja]|uniref:Putative WRKY transcription factor 39 n=1 Tax=Glycine soja TaxID=3848 RepID=A0A445L089_GLYSO|nr:putative WRKY transcription factor 39 [Glycine soja]
MLISETMVGGLIGRCGSNISRIKNEFGAMIKKPSTQIASINKDFKNAMMLKSESHQTLPEGFITNINDQPKPPPKMETTGNNFLFNRTHGDDLLMNLDQFQAISMKSEANMEEVEQANRVVVESCHRVLSLLSQPRDQVQHRNLMVETGETVVRFKKVVSMLHNGLGHARVRKLKNPQIPSSHQSIFLDNPNCKTLTNNNNNNHHLKKSILSPNQLTSIISVAQRESGGGGDLGGVAMPA